MPAVTRTYTIAIIDDTGCENGILGQVDAEYLVFDGSAALLRIDGMEEIASRMRLHADRHPPTEVEIADAHRARFDRRDGYAA